MLQYFKKVVTYVVRWHVETLILILQLNKLKSAQFFFVGLLLAEPAETATAEKLIQFYYCYNSMSRSRYSIQLWQ